MIFLALRHLAARKRQSFFTLMGIFFGTAAFVIISGFFKGFQNYLVDSLVSGDAHIKITKNDEKTGAEAIRDSLFDSVSESVQWTKRPNPKLAVTEIRNPLGWIEKIKASSETVAYGFQFSTTALITKAGASQSATLIGTEPDSQVKITNIESKITKGSFTDLSRGLDMLVVGETLAEELGLAVDDVVSVTSSTNITYPMKVVGVYSSGNRLSDKATVYTSLSTAQKIAGQNGKINQISVRVKDPYKAAAIANEWKSFSSERVESWDQANASFLSIFQTQDLMRYTVISILLVVAGFSIYNILSMVVMQKRRDIAILRSMGYNAKDILKLFLVQGLILGSLGSVVGLVVGFLVCLYLETLTMGGPVGNRNVSMEFSLSIYGWAFALGIAASCIAAYLPSRSASKMTPIEIIRAGAE